MATATADALSDAAREFVGRAPHRLLIGGERVDGRRRRARSRRSTRRPASRSAGRRGRRRRTSTGRSPPRAAALEGPLRKVSPSKRAGLMYTLAELIKANGDELAELESLDNGKPLAAAKGDIAASVAHLRYYAGWPTKIEGETIPVSGARPALLHAARAGRRLRPDRALELPAADGDLEDRPGARRRLPARPQAGRADAADRAAARRARARGGLPARGRVNVLTGDGETGAALVDHPGVDKVAFTGSTVVGREIGAKCGRGAEAGDARARRQEPEHHPPRRRPRGRGEGLVPRPLLELRSVLQRRLTALRAGADLRRGGLEARRVRVRARRSARGSTPSRTSAR